MPPQPCLRLARLGRDGLPGPALRPAVVDIGGDIRIVQPGCDFSGALPGIVALPGVRHWGDVVPAEGGRHRMVGYASLGRDGVHGVVLLQVPFPQISLDVGVAEAPKDRTPAIVCSLSLTSAYGVSRGRIEPL